MILDSACRRDEEREEQLRSWLTTYAHRCSLIGQDRTHFAKWRLHRGHDWTPVLGKPTLHLNRKPFCLDTPLADFQHATANFYSAFAKTGQFLQHRRQTEIWNERSPLHLGRTRLGSLLQKLTTGRRRQPWRTRRWPRCRRCSLSLYGRHNDRFSFERPYGSNRWPPHLLRPFH